MKKVYIFSNLFMLLAGTPGGFYLNGIVHFVFHSVRADGYCGINYNRLTVSSLLNSSSLFGLNSSDYCYPSVSSYGADEYDQSVMIGFMKINSTISPSIRVVNCDNDMKWSGSTHASTGPKEYKQSVIHPAPDQQKIDSLKAIRGKGKTFCYVCRNQGTLPR